jgi:hypothetical protein
MICGEVRLASVSIQSLFTAVIRVTHLEEDGAGDVRAEAEADRRVPGRPVEEAADEEIGDLGRLQRGGEGQQPGSCARLCFQTYNLAEDERLPTVELGLLLAGLKDVAVGDELWLHLGDDTGGDEDEPRRERGRGANVSAGATEVVELEE